MKRTRLADWLAACACVGLVLPSWSLAADAAHPAGHSSARAAETRDTTAAAPVQAVSDIALTDDGGLTGTVVTSAGTQVAGGKVAVVKGGRPVATATTDRGGQFRVAGLRGGVYQLQSGKGSVSCRLWASDTAPPAAERSALIVADAGAVRGQRPLWDLANDPLIIGAIVVAAIAIPVAIHNSRNHGSSS